MPNTPTTEKVIHLNQLQEQILNAKCKETYCASARGVGKTTILAFNQVDCITEMPRSLRLFLGPSYRKVITDLIPNMTVQWEKMGYIRDVHYTIGNSPIPKKKGWDEPYYAPPPNYRQFLIHWFTGAGYRIGSADRKVTMNGLNLDGIDADELKLIPEEVFGEIIATNRANPDRVWSKKPQHNSILAFTDKYWTRKNADWIMKKKPLADMKKVNEILILQSCLNEMTLIQDGKIMYTDPKATARIEKLLNTMRTETIAFFEAAAYVNMPAITPSFILQMQRNMGVNEFRAKMLNHDLIRNDVKQYFYPALNENYHGYIADDFDKLDTLNFNFAAGQELDCDYDTDLDRTKPIEISCDWGGTISCLGVFQEGRHQLSWINSFFVLHPDGIKQLAEKFNAYYIKHQKRHSYLRFYYDPSGNNKMPNSSETVAQEFTRHLTTFGWRVDMMHLGAHNNPRYELRFELAKQIMAPAKLHDPKFPTFFINRNNCKEPLVSMLDAGLKKWEKKLKKDKSSEKPGSGVLPQHATNFSDVFDYIMMHKYGHLLDAVALPSTMGD